SLIAGNENSFIALNEGLITTNIWDFGDGTIITNQAYVTHRFATAGTYVVRIIGYNNSNPEGITTEVVVEVVPEVIIYVDAGSTNPISPYTNWLTAATNIQDGINAAVLPGSTVLVADGVYDKGVYENDYGTNRIIINKPITVKSANGPSKTYIVGDLNGKIRCVWMTNDAVLSGFTLMNGSTWFTRGSMQASGGGVLGSSLFATVTNCVLSNNYTRFGGGACNCSLFNSIIVSNDATYGGAACDSELYSCILNYNTASYGGGAYNSTMSNCILSGNYASYYDGGGAYNSTLFNCVLSGNLAIYNGGGGANSTMYNCILNGNTAWSHNNGGGAYNSTLVNCTVSKNYASFYNGGGCAVSTCVLTNCIVYYNDDYINTVNSNHYNSTFYYSCTTPLPESGFGNTDAPPVFLDLTNGNYHLAPDSPCIDKGDNSVVQATFTDLDGRQRIIGERVDIGAYEFDPGDLDSDGMPNEWELVYGLSPTDYRDRDADIDNDGLTNFREYLANTNPSDSNDTLKLTTEFAPSNLLIIQFKAKANRKYAIEYKDKLEGSWKRLIEYDSEANDRVLSITNNLSSEKQFYRVVIP
ncbi:MAG TPA: choice-of-anchor Q domain-containing protein, partial [Verrucomicrobiota bacterium]|nr:choice-of-anchor Q domain-containing protein [Verrucomicrobiota bacterium]